MPGNVGAVSKGIKDTWNKLGQGPRSIIIVAIGLAFAGSMWLFAQSAIGPKYDTLWSNLDPADAGAVIAELDRQGIPYKLGEAGRTIKVPASQVHLTRLSLASLGLPSSGVVGFESIGSNGIWATDFERKVQYVRALSGELTRTIKSISGVMDARVHIVLPEPTVFVSQRRDATAAVLLQVQPLQEVSASCVKGIINLVSRSVEGLSPNDVTVMDSQGRLLSQSYGDATSAAGLSGSAFELTRQIEKEYEVRLMSMLSPVLGAKNIVCTVRAELDLSQVRTVDTIYSTEGEGTLRSYQETTETYQGQSTASGQAGGLDVPNYTFEDPTDGSSSSRTEVVRNYEVNQRVIETIGTPGAIKNLSVAVMVNKELDDDQQGSIVETVSTALGLDPMRNDRITVTGALFDTSLADTISGSFGEGPVPLNKLYIYGAAVGAALVLGTIVLLLTRKKKKGRDVERAPVLVAASEEAAAVNAPVPPEYLARQRTKGSVEQMAKANPGSVAALVKTWILEDEH